MKLSAFYIAETLDLKKLRAAQAGELIFENPSELFYRIDGDKFFYAVDYGVAVFANMGDLDVSKNLQFLDGFSVHPIIGEKTKDDFLIDVIEGSAMRCTFDTLIVSKLDEQVLQITMMNLAHSVALDQYAQGADDLLLKIQKTTNTLEQKGSLDMNKKDMLRFIGRMLNQKNRIVENLYIFDSPELTWDNDFLEKIHQGLVRSFDLQSRFREIEYTFKIIEDNLSVFRELSSHKESSTLEWIIIVLILIEVANMFISKFH